jgi:hypothetical protein
MQFPASTLLSNRSLRRFLGASALAVSASAACAQGNSPYSRYGLGDLAPTTHIINRGMGGISAGDDGVNHINFSNPASYSRFQALKQPGKSKKLMYGRVLFDVGVAIDNKTLREPGAANKFTSSEINLSYIQIGIPLRPHWGLVLGIRPMSRVSYYLQQRSLLGVDSTYTEYRGSGGVYLPSIGTGVAFGSFSVGMNFGYLFGNRDVNNTRYFNNDTVAYYQALYRTQTSFGKIFANFGAQYQFDLGKESDKARLAAKKAPRGQYIRLGVSGNLRSDLSGRQDVTVGTFTYDPDGTLTDTLYSSKNNNAGKITYPSTITAGFMAGGNTKSRGFWQGGLDVTQTNWNDFRNFGAVDAVRSNMIVHAGGQFLPDAFSQSFFGRTAYRAGVAFGRDYVTASGNMPFWSASAGLGLSLGHRNPQHLNQTSLINLGFEYINRGNNTNALKENNFRLSIGLTLGDSWFVKRRYD